MCFSSSSVTIISRFPSIVALPTWLFRERGTVLLWKKEESRKERSKTGGEKIVFLSFFLFGRREGGGDSRDRGALCTYLGVALMRASVFFFLPLKRIFRPVWTGWNLPSPREIKRGHLPDRRKITYVCPRRTITWRAPITRMPSLRNNNCIPSENTRYEPFLFFFSSSFHFFFHTPCPFSSLRLLSTQIYIAITSSYLLHEYLNVSRDRNRWIIQRWN